MLDESRHVGHAIGVEENHGHNAGNHIEPHPASSAAEDQQCRDANEKGKDKCPTRLISLCRAFRKELKRPQNSVASHRLKNARGPEVATYGTGDCGQKNAGCDEPSEPENSIVHEDHIRIGNELLARSHSTADQNLNSVDKESGQYSKQCAQGN